MLRKFCEKWSRFNVCPTSRSYKTTHVSEEAENTEMY